MNDYISLLNKKNPTLCKIIPCTCNKATFYYTTYVPNDINTSILLNGDKFDMHAAKTVESYWVVQRGKCYKSEEQFTTR